MRAMVIAMFVAMGCIAKVYGSETTITNISLCGSDDRTSISFDSANGEILSFGKVEGNAIDGRGGCVAPGFLDSASTLGVEEVGLSTDSEDQGYEGEGLGAGFEVALAFNRNSSMVPIFLEEGITHAMVRPVSNDSDAFAGQGSVVNLTTGDFGSSQAVFVHLGEQGRNSSGNSRAAALQRLLRGLEDALLFDDKRGAYETNRLRQMNFSIDDLEALADVINGEKKLAIYVNRASEIEIVLMMLADWELDLVLMGAREAWKVADLIQEFDVPVVLNVLDNLPSNFDQLGARLDHAKLLHDRGILFSFMTEDVYSEFRVLAQGAGVAVAYGLPWQAAMDAITINPALIWEPEGYSGELEVGAQATFTVWSDDPFEVTSHVTHVIVDGKLVEVNNRQRLLRDRYRDLNAAPFQYR